ncbi:Liver carboxylesterase 1 [Harpegnathos saltator]|uniref:Liver carboxylesterase 1 n=2 Tax=Harpegnathos saltator TaxID=610380 RepID=E2B2Q4_HARSA|nr:Liver carboxylesterase 1 [Harpegnathos saltator]
MDRRVSLLFILFLCSFVYALDVNLTRQKRVVGGVPALQPPEDDPVVFVNKNGQHARIIGSRDPNKGFYTFRGIRFAKPPTGDNRFQRASPVLLEGDYNATTWGPPCPQPSRDGTDRIIGNEDCLFLNVFTPSLPDSSDGYPVLVWIHGGGFRRGSACQYEMRNLISKKMVVVSVQYRLGSLGFLSTGTKELPGNNGMFDMILAVDWVKDYIHFFGGNSKKIVAFGHDTGASSAMMLSLSKFCKNSFSGLIAMSGSILSHFAVDRNPADTAKDVARHNGCPIDNTREMVSCLREVPAEELIRTDSRLENVRMVAQGFISGLSNLLGAGPVLEGADDNRSLPNFLVESPEDTLKFNNFPSIPLLTGVMKDETGGAISGGYKNEVLNKLNTIPNYLTNDLVPHLQDTIPNIQNGSRLVPQAFSGYFNILQGDGARDTIGKVAEAVGDSLYNVPAFLTVDNWSKKANAFLYTFDHKGKKNYGKDFLAGLPIVDAKQLSDGNLNHGDDLGYVFGPNTITGESMGKNDEEPDEADERVTEIFTDMIANFARSGTVNIPAVSSRGAMLDEIPTYSSDTNSFVSITTAPQSMRNFRYCEMGLWTVAPERLQSSMCSLYKVPLQLLQQGVKGTASMIEKPLGTLGGFASGLQSGLNFADKSENQNTKVPREENKTQEGSRDRLLSKAPIPQIPFFG